MKPIIIAISAVLALASAVDARSHHSTYSRSYGEADYTTHSHYTNVSGHRVHSPTHTFSGHVPAGASARCGDGSYSFSEHHRGTCSHHGGVSGWL